MCVLHSSVARSKNKASNLTISTERLCLLDQSLLHERVCVLVWKLSSLSPQSPEEVRGTIGPTVLAGSEVPSSTGGSRALQELFSAQGSQPGTRSYRLTVLSTVFGIDEHFLYNFFKTPFSSYKSSTCL